MNASRFVCDFKGINAQTLEDKVLEVCRDFYQNQRIYTKLKVRLTNASKDKKKHRKTSHIDSRTTDRKVGTRHH